MRSLAQRLDMIEPLVLSMAGEIKETVYGVVDKVVGGEPHFIRKWKGTIGNMRPTDDAPTVYVVEKLEPFILTHKKHKCAYGGRAGTKSIMAMDAMIGDVNASGSKVFCLREHMKSLRNSIYAGIKERYRSLDFKGFTPVPSQWEIKHNSGGVISFGGMQNIKDMKGSFDYKYFLLEEADATSQETLDILGPTLRGVEGAELWYIWNPQSSTDPMSTEFINPYQESLDRDGIYQDEHHLIIKVGFEDNPWFMADSSLRQEYEKDKKKKEDGRMSAARFNHIWHGHFNDDVEDSLIETDWFDACVDAHLKLGFEPRGAKIVTHDPSDVGGDAKGLAMRHGVVFTHAEEMDCDNANTAIDMACSFASNQGADVFGWDCDGLGAPLRNQVAANFNNKSIRTFMFKGSESPHNKDAIFEYGEEFGIDASKTVADVIANKRAQGYVEVANRCRKTYEAVVLGKYHNPDDLISFSSEVKNLQKLRSELCRLPLKPNGSGRILLYTKQEMRTGITLSSGRRVVIPSPNIGDCVMMSFDNSGMIAPMAKAVIPRPIRPMGRR